VREGLFFKRREIWLPTWRTLLLGLVAALVLFVAFIKALPGFLAPNKPLNAPVLAIEGWVSEHGLHRAIALEKEHHYKMVIVTGGPIEKGMNISSYETYANLGASRLRELGFPNTNIITVPSPKVPKDRTYHGALMLKEYALKNTSYREIDLLGGGVHGRRSWLLFETACRPEIKVGVISDTDEEFDMTNWWRTSYGVRGVINELIGYLYARLVFHPD
jgi:hypothetical protein